MSEVKDVLDGIARDIEASPEALADVVPITRQQRRAQEREAEKIAERAERPATAEEMLEAKANDARKLALLKSRHMLFALVRAQGRVRISAADLSRVTDRCKLDCRVQPNGDMVVSFVDG